MLSNITRLALAAAALAIVALPAVSQRATPDDQKAIAAAKELMIATGADKSIDVMLGNMIPQLAAAFKSQRPDKAKEIDDVMRAMALRMYDRKKEMLDLLAPVYAKHFNAAEIGEVTAFFKSPIGLKFVAKQPQVLNESMQIGRQWGERIGSELELEMRRELKSRGIEL